MKIPRALGLPAVLFTVAFATAAVVVPALSVLVRAAGAAGHLLDPEILAVARATASQALWSTAFSIALGLPLGLWVGARGPRSLARAALLLALPYGVPTVVAGAAWVAWLGRSGPLGGLDWAYSLKAVILAHAVFNIPFIALVVARARAAVPPRLLEAAETLGARYGSRLRFVLWPELKWALAAGAVQVFGLCAMSFALVLILGGGPPVQTLETALYSRVRFGSLDLGGAAACAAWETLLTLGPWVAVLALQGRASGRAGALSIAGTSGGRGRGWPALAVCALFLVPYLAVFQPARLARALGAEALTEVGPALGVSLRIAALAASGALAVAVLGLVGSAYLRGRGRRFAGTALELLLAVPGGVSVLVLGLGFLLAYGKYLDPLSGSLTCIALIQIAIFSPTAYRTLWPVAQHPETRLLEAAATLGASPFTALRFVEWPRWKGPVFSAFALVVGASLGEVAAVSLFYSENLVPVPLVISRWMGQYRFDEAQGLSAVLLAVAVAIMFLVSRGEQTRERQA